MYIARNCDQSILLANFYVKRREYSTVQKIRSINSETHYDRKKKQFALEKHDPQNIAFWNFETVLYFSFEDPQEDHNKSRRPKLNNIISNDIISLSWLARKGPFPSSTSKTPGPLDLPLLSNHLLRKTVLFSCTRWVIVHNVFGPFSIVLYGRRRISINYIFVYSLALSVP